MIIKDKLKEQRTDLNCATIPLNVYVLPGFAFFHHELESTRPIHVQEPLEPFLATHLVHERYSAIGCGNVRTFGVHWPVVIDAYNIPKGYQRATQNCALGTLTVLDDLWKIGTSTSRK
jgi:hypothetical protein